ncbi:serine/threonine protein kinase [Anoxynatronum buryatiense]|uniref:Serine/threonine protein kinase n=1 Tax=Anoxynatronum buryatiense TaxID=489973 RepID=A0AA45WXT8_9CLOT|nr:serine/threonine-protein kinase [Anoxynatronum buryatiense]SMP65186.1 Serine/threonine protein kinase [Anoxynatronum buryatiense]
MTNEDKVCRGCMRDRDEEIICPVCGWEHGAGPLSQMHLPPGTILQGKYLVGRALGQGGFGITYLARDLMLDVKLAIKEYLPQDLASRSHGRQEVSVHTESLGLHYHDGLERFLQEAKTLARFEGHPNIVSVRDFFKANETAYFVMSYIEGITLKEYVKEQGDRIPAEQAVMIMMPVLEALKEVHGAGILHRDISPDNIFMTAKGQIVLIDFGAARQAVKDKGRSMSIIMKPGFTPEEQYRSKGHQGPWTDLYALGATMYRAITGQMPPESLDRLAEDELIPPSAMGIAISQGTEAALLKAMAVMGKDRFQTAEDFQEALATGMMASGKAAPALPFQSPPLPPESSQSSSLSSAVSPVSSQHASYSNSSSPSSSPAPSSLTPPLSQAVPPVSTDPSATAPSFPQPGTSPGESPLYQSAPSFGQSAGQSAKPGAGKWLLGIGVVVAAVVIALVVGMNLGGGKGNSGADPAQSTQTPPTEAPVEVTEETEAAGLAPVQEEAVQEQPVPVDLYRALNQTGRLDLLGISEAELFQRHGQPASTFYWEGGTFYEYNDFYAMINEYSAEREVIFLGFRQLPGISSQAAFDEVRQVYGDPEWDEIGASNQSHLLSYHAQGYSVMFEGFSDRKVDLITVTEFFEGYDGDFEGDHEYDETLQALYELGYDLWFTWVYVASGTPVWSDPFEGVFMGEITSDGDIYVTDYEVDSDYNLWLQLQLVDENGQEVYGWVIY